MMKPNRAASPKGTNVAKMVVMGQGGVNAPEQTLDFSTLDNVCETAPEGTFNIAEAVEVKSDEPMPVPAAPVEETSVTDKAPESAQTPTPEVDPDGIEDPQFKGKSRKELVESYKHLQALNGRMSNEVGDYRKFFDQFILNQANNKSQPAQAAPVQPAPAKDDGKLLELMLGDPEAFVDTVEKRLMGKLQSVGVQAEVQKVYEKNQDLMNSNEFKTWALENVDFSIRQLADRDPKTCNFIFNSYRALSGKQAPTEAKPPQPAPRNVVVSAAASGTGTPTKVPPKVWTRTEVRELYANNQAEYRRREAEITAAYQAGLVLDK